MSEVKVRSLPKRLDHFSKIIIATGQINYMASSVNGVNLQLKAIRKQDEDFLRELIKTNDEFLKEVVVDLKNIMEKVGNYINGVDCICPIDVRVSKVPFEIVVENKDEVENDYEDQTA